MTPRQYRAALDALELTQVRAAELLGVQPRSSRRWISGKVPVPQSVALTLRLMLHFRLGADDALALLKNQRKAGHST
jgi:plasmid maintenance system antidote protein VapI